MTVKGWIATVTVIALAVPSGIVAAAEVTPRGTHARHHRSHHQMVLTRVVDRRPITGYLGRPVAYIPAPFPLGFDFGFGW
jgi:hypothetical protein